MVMLIEGDGPAMTAYRLAIQLGSVTARFIRATRGEAKLFYVRADDLTDAEEDQVFDSVPPVAVWSYDTCRRGRRDQGARDYDTMRAGRYKAGA